MRRTTWCAVALLVGWGLVKVPAERALMGAQRRAHFHTGQLNFDVREQVPQGAFIAALSGFRSVVADLLMIQAHTAWENTQWGSMKASFDAATSLAPRVLLFWETAGWHMAYNASVAAREDPAQPREALRIRAQREYWRLGETYLLRGIGFNWDRALLYDRLAQVYDQKFQDPCRAAWAYGEAAKRPDAMGYTRRMAAYQLARCPGHEAAAYAQLLALYHRGKGERLPTLLKLIPELENKLGVPASQRIDITADLREATPR